MIDGGSGELGLIQKLQENWTTSTSLLYQSMGRTHCGAKLKQPLHYPLALRTLLHS